MLVLEGDFNSQTDAFNYVCQNYMNAVSVIDYSFVGKVAYLLCVAKPHWSDKFTYVCVLHFSYQKGVWKFKEYDESMNPVQYLDCPISFLERSDLLTDQAKSWKELCLAKQKDKIDSKKDLQTKISILEEKIKSNDKLIIDTIKHGSIEFMDFYSNSKSQIIARNENGAVFRFKLLDITLDEIKKTKLSKNKI